MKPIRFRTMVIMVVLLIFTGCGLTVVHEGRYRDHDWGAYGPYSRDYDGGYGAHRMDRHHGYYGHRMDRDSDYDRHRGDSDGDYDGHRMDLDEGYHGHLMGPGYAADNDVALGSVGPAHQNLS